MFIKSQMNKVIMIRSEIKDLLTCAENGGVDRGSDCVSNNEPDPDSGCVSNDDIYLLNKNSSNEEMKSHDNLISNCADANRTTRRIFGKNSETIGVNDILMGYRKSSFENNGNRRFRAIILRNFKRYSMAPSKLSKTRMVNDIFKSISYESSPGRFLKFNEKSDLWEQVSENIAKERVSQSLRKAFLKQQKIAMSDSFMKINEAEVKSRYQPNHCEKTYEKLYSIQQDIFKALLSSNILALGTKDDSKDL